MTENIKATELLKVTQNYMRAYIEHTTCDYNYNEQLTEEELVEIIHYLNSALSVANSLVVQLDMLDNTIDAKNNNEI